jgi:hypothetical protein
MYTTLSFPNFAVHLSLLKIGQNSLDTPQYDVHIYNNGNIRTYLLSFHLTHVFTIEYIWWETPGVEDIGRNLVMF